MEKILIGAVVVLYNPTRVEIENIASYKSDVDYLVIIDNSLKNNYVIIKENVGLSESIQYISHSDNIGLCKALNEGIRVLSSLKCQWAVVFDADSKLATNVFEVYRKTINLYNDIEQVAVFAPQHTFDRRKKEIYAGYKKIKWAMTSGWLINIVIFHQIGGFFEELFVDGLDMDYCYHAIENGYCIVECGEAMINHHPAESKEIKILGKCFKYGYASPERYFMQARCLTWTSIRYKKSFDIVMYLYKWLKVILLFNDKKTYLISMLNGTNQGLRLLKQYRIGGEK